MGNPVESGKAGNRLTQLLGGTQKYWNLSVPKTANPNLARNKDTIANCFESSSSSTFTERSRHQESISSILTGLEKSMLVRSKRGEETVMSDNPPERLDAFFEELATMIVHERISSARNRETFNQDITEIAASLAQSRDNPDASREKKARRKARIVAANLQEEIFDLKSPTPQESSIPDLVETSESNLSLSTSRSSMKSTSSRSSSRRRSIVRSRRLSKCAMDSMDVLDISESSIAKYSSRTGSRKQTSRSRSRRSFTHEKQNSATTSSFKPRRKDPSEVKSRRLIKVEVSESSEESIPSRHSMTGVVLSGPIRRKKCPDLNLTVDSNGASVLTDLPSLQSGDRRNRTISMKDTASLSLKTPEQTPTATTPTLLRDTACEMRLKSPCQKDRRGLRRTSPWRRRLLAHELSHNVMQQSEHVPKSPSRKHQSKADHSLPSTAPIKDPTTPNVSCGKKVNSLQQKTKSSKQSTGKKTNDERKSRQKNDMDQTSAWNAPVPFLATVDSNNPFWPKLPFTECSENESFADTFFAIPDTQVDDLPKIPSRLCFPKSDLINRRNETRCSIQSIRSAPDSPVSRRILRRAQALPPAQLVL